MVATKVLSTVYVTKEPSAYPLLSEESATKLNLLQSQYNK